MPFDCDLVKQAQIDAAWACHNSRFRGERRPVLGLALKERLCGEQNWRCCYCGVRMMAETGPMRPTFEHVVPRSVGGPDVYENLVAACQDCNHARGSVITTEVVEAVTIWEGWTA